MGLTLPQTVKIRTNGNNRKHYESLGYKFEKCGEFIEVNVLDLTKGSHTPVKCTCDFCGKEMTIWYKTLLKNREKNKLVCCNDQSCVNKQIENTFMTKYNVKSIFDLQEVKDKSKETLKKHYGDDIESPFQAEEVKKKSKETSMAKYNVEFPAQSNEVKDKIKKTNQERYGRDWYMSTDEFWNKSKETWKKNYGENIENPFQAEEVKNKSKETWTNNYGVDNPNKSQKIRNKTKETCRKKYGGNNPMASKEVRDKFAQTCKEKYGMDNPNKLKKVMDKKKETCRKHYGVDWPMQSEEVKDKVFDSFQYNSTGPCSKPQKYISYLLNGILNKHILNFMVDAYLEKENLVIEYDGSGHFLGDLINNKSKTPSKEAILKEKARENKLIDNNYRLIRIIAKRDRIPSDEVILNLIDEFKNSDFKVIRIDIDEGTISKDDTEKWNYDFGELRKITKKSLEKFESNNDSIS